MSSFTSELWATPLDNGRDWKIVRPYTFHVGSQHSRQCVKVPKGFITDFASIPRFFWFLPDWATYNKAAPPHDLLYKTKQLGGKPITRKWADNIFLEAMLVAFRCHRAGYVIARIEYYAVRLFGWLVWR